jgi:hypothetical protein
MGLASTYPNPISILRWPRLLTLWAAFFFYAILDFMSDMGANNPHSKPFHQIGKRSVMIGRRQNDIFQRLLNVLVISRCKLIPALVNQDLDEKEWCACCRPQSHDCQPWIPPRQRPSSK